MTVVKKETLLGTQNPENEEETNDVSVFEKVKGKTPQSIQDDLDTYFGDVLPRQTTDENKNEDDADFDDGDKSSDDSDNGTSEDTEQSSDNENSGKSATTKDTSQGDASDEDDEDPNTKSQNNKRPSRAKKRINQLLADNKSLETDLQKERQTRLEIERERDILRKNLSATNVKSLEYQIKEIKSRMVQAQEEANTEEYVNLVEQLNDLQSNKKAYESVYDKYKDFDPTKEPVKKPEQLQTQRKPSELRQELQQEWIESTPWFITQQRLYEDDVFNPTQAHQVATNYTIQLEQSLIQEGYDPETEEFYETLTKRLNKVIKLNGLDKVLLGTVQSENNTTGVPSENVSVNNMVKTEEENEDTNVNSSRPKVSGSTRTSASAKSKNSSKTITVDPLTRTIAEGLGFDPVAYAQGKMVPLK
jgi:hypothetical protein